MKFELREFGSASPSPLGSGSTRWDWTATVQGEVVAVAPQSYSSEQEARSAIAKARKAFAGAKFAKVVAPENDLV